MARFLPVAGARGGLPVGWLHVLFWAGLRGAVAVAMALALPVDVPQRALLQEITFGIVLFTLLVQGSTAGIVVRRAVGDGSATATAPDGEGSGRDDPGVDHRTRLVPDGNLEPEQERVSPHPAQQIDELEPVDGLVERRPDRHRAVPLEEHG